MESPRAEHLAELGGRALLVAAFGGLASVKVMGITSLFTAARIDLLAIATQAAHLAFLLLVVCMAIIRLKPVRTSEGWETRISAMIGSFLPLLLLALPPAEIGEGMRIVALVMVALGWALSAYVLIWLGRSFSVMPQARRLVTTGPYSVVRHPLYLSEEISILGIALLQWGLVALLIVIVHWLFQLRRMANEEKVLSSQFPEYTAYSARTPRIVPRLRSAPQISA